MPSDGCDDGEDGEAFSHPLFGSVPISDRDAERLLELRKTINDLDIDARVWGTNYAEAELTVRLGDLDDESATARTEAINRQYEWTRRAWDALEDVDDDE